MGAPLDRIVLAEDVMPLPHLLLLFLSLTHQAKRVGLCLAQDGLGITIGLLLRGDPQLLRREQCFVHRTLPLTESPELLLEALQPFVQLQPLPDQTVEFFRDPGLELFHLCGIIPAKDALELLCPNIARGQVKRVVAHEPRSPNRRVPNRTIVAPSSTATR